MIVLHVSILPLTYSKVREVTVHGTKSQDEKRKQFPWCTAKWWEGDAGKVIGNEENLRLNWGAISCWNPVNYMPKITVTF